MYSFLGLQGRVGEREMSDAKGRKEREGMVVVVIGKREECMDKIP